MDDMDFNVRTKVEMLKIMALNFSWFFNFNLEEEESRIFKD